MCNRVERAAGEAFVFILPIAVDALRYRQRRTRAVQIRKKKKGQI